MGLPGSRDLPTTRALRGVRDRLGAAIFARVAGEEGPRNRARIHGTPGPRRFAADSAIARVHGDASMFVGGIRALMLQTLQPQAMQAVADHSGYRGDMFGRLARTSTYLAVTTFGTVDQAEQAIAQVRAIHARVTGTMPDGTPYAASDPHLLAWIHVAQVDSFLRAHQAFGLRPLDQAGRDAYVRETAVVARRLGVLDPPTTEAQVATVLAAYRDELAGTAVARDAIRFLVWRPPLPLPARAPYLGLWLAAVSLMPPWTRRELGLPRAGPVDRALGRLLGQGLTRAIRWALGTGRAEARQMRSAADAGPTGPTGATGPEAAGRRAG